jgi:hypothetical protein
VAKRLDWHTAFYQAMQAELINYLPELTFEREHYLNAQPLRMDILIIKKNPDIVIEKHIAQHFKGYNIIENKSPDDSLSFSDYIKVIGYACIYQALEHIPVDDIALTMVCSREPVQLINTISQNHWLNIFERHNGIFEVIGEHFPIRIVVGKKLSARDNIWIKNLNKGLNTSEALRIQKTNRIIKQNINMDAYIDVVLNANLRKIRKEVYVVGFEIFEELIEEYGLVEKFEEQLLEKYEEQLLEKYKAKVMAEGKTERIAEGKAEGKAEGIVEGKAEGKAEGIETSMYILQALKKNEPIESIAERYQQPVSQIILYRDILNSPSMEGSPYVIS